ncbi:MAG: hypothetical protein AMXMBFR84_06300 [Candidatus Hydrogenedentota bacterium]
MAAALMAGPACLFAEIVTFRVTENDQAIPCRIHLWDAEHKPVKVESYPWWHDHFSCDGTAALDVPPGSYSYEIDRGPEYRAVSGTFELAGGGKQDVVASLNRMANMASRGWWCGDLHVHRPIEHAELLMQSEDLYIAPFITWWNAKNLWGDTAPQEPLLRKLAGNRYYHIMGGEDEREGGAFLYFNRTEPLEISKADREWPSPMSFLERVADERETYIDIEKPFWWDVPTALAMGHGDSIGLANNHMCRGGMYESEAWGKPRDAVRLPAPRGNGTWTQEIYYHLLNTGLRVPPSAGSASGVLPNPVGYNRVYVQLDGELTYEKWWKGLLAGRSFVTNGPLLLAAASGELPGHVFKSASPLSVDVSAEIIARDPYTTIEIVKNGRVTHTVAREDVAADGFLASVAFEDSGWFLVRVIADVQHTFRFASSAPFYVEIGENPRRVSRESAQFFLDWTRERRERVKHDDPEKLAEVIAYHNKAEAFWSQRVDDANAK